MTATSRRTQRPSGQRIADTELLRFATAGSVDDGKSTLIGRLLHDAKSILADQLAHVKETSERRGDGELNLALLTDGLRAEREQGITIDVAYRSFQTDKRRFIIADCPGHEQYTRNMVTGASTADLALVLVDARNGLVRQSRRHAAITALLRTPHLVVAINKMDLVDYDQSRLRRDRRGLHELVGRARVRRGDVHPDLRAEGRQRRRALRATWTGTRARRCSTTSRRSRSPATATSRTGASRSSG